ncbi:MAG: hypothetical protein ACSLE5_02355 [Porticoccaceae bacterium]
MTADSPSPEETPSTVPVRPSAAQTPNTVETTGVEADAERTDGGPTVDSLNLGNLDFGSINLGSVDFDSIDIPILTDRCDSEIDSRSSESE